MILVANVELAIVILVFFAPFFPTKCFNLDKVFAIVALCIKHEIWQELEFQSFNGAEETDKASAYHKVRLFTVARYAAEKPVAELDGGSILQQWAISSEGI